MTVVTPTDRPKSVYNHTSRVTVVTPSDRPKSVRNRCVIEVFGGVFCVVTLLFGFFCECRGFCHRTESDLFLFPPLETKDQSRSDEVIQITICINLSFGNLDVLKAVQINRIRPRTVPSGTIRSHQKVQIQTFLLLRYIHHFITRFNE